MNNLEDTVKAFHKNGIAVVKKFASDEECDAMIAEMRKIVKDTNMDEHSRWARVTWGASERYSSTNPSVNVMSINYIIVIIVKCFELLTILMLQQIEITIF